MAYSETRIVISSLAHVLVLVFVANLLKVSLELKLKRQKDTVLKEEPVKIIEINIP